MYILIIYLDVILLFPLFFFSIYIYIYIQYFKELPIALTVGQGAHFAV